jgi:hypothetical protein
MDWPTPDGIGRILLGNKQVRPALQEGASDYTIITVTRRHWQTPMHTSEQSVCL